MRRFLTVLATCLTTALAFTGCGADPSAQPSSTPEASPKPSPTPTEEPPELVGGGTELFPDKRFIALYGHPEYPSLGALGEQSPEESVDRVIELAEMYEAHSDEEIHPAFEIIVTVASEHPGDDGNYSAESDPEQIAEYIDVAEQHDVYVVLDLQPGHADFLTQAKIY